MMVGIPGSGKTFWIEENINKEEYNIVCPDLIRKELTGSISNLSQDKKVWKQTKERVSHFLLEGKNVILDATNVKSGYRKNFIKDLPPCRMGAKIFDVSLEKAKERIKKDIKDKKERSHVPQGAVDIMYENFISQSTPEQLMKEGFEILE